MQTIELKPAIAEAFSQRRALMPFWGQQPLAAEAWPAAWQDINQTPLKNTALAYIHIPFCANRCVFCGFYKNAWKEEHGKPYVDRLIADLQQSAASRVAGGEISAVYLGGGTPTALSGADLARLLRAVQQYLPLSEDCEITVEGRISHFDRAKAEACLGAGANRFSIGVQTFHSPLRRRLGRQHSGEEAAAYLAELAAGTDAVIVADLMFGLPGQDTQLWAHDLDTALSLGLDGIDVYAFNLFPGLPIQRMLEKGVFPPMSALPEQLGFYQMALSRFAAAGWQQLSNSHFGSALGRERNRYNLAIKSGQSCLAFGSGAGGSHAGYAYSIEPDLERYLSAPPAAVSRIAQADPTQHWVAALQGSIEVGQINATLLPAACMPLLHTWQQQGLISPLNADLWKIDVLARFWGPSMARALVDLTQRKAA
ncbi:heme anaerobic degradation radical SAM methyltransferase ChuW/HutW [Iodobacter sp. CM08]|uniref:heme anaerobic degradation radical SAM methyltransferase ChuW/HutW n=1 Tax=Iodobacter sp. CM08 TaxID=3085902 RepID=UPI002981ECA2|nr:heme anaerobic degradation radical SAM methyltransferase ChuW/HutW [Iodobacter sp. CM08]MDW5418549.1 heme anaerobic degradation radical SAM methyltransferase ChuW/HutW [Iodobacter sp. CM08]